MRSKRGKQLGGEAPRRSGRLTRQRHRREEGRPYGLLGMLALGLFVVGIVTGFAWAMDRKLRGGILEQRVEAARRPDWVPLRSLPEYVPQAFLAVADPSLLREGSLRARQKRASLAEQLVEQVHLLPNSLVGDARQMVMGPVLEQRLTRRALVELYLNRVYLGREQGYPIFGLHAAAREFFDKEPQQLTLGEAATLAGLLLAPRIEDPESRVGAVGSRRNEVLQVMLLGGLISEAQFQQANAEPLGFQPGLDQLPMSRPLDYGKQPRPIRLPPNLRPVPEDSPEASPGGASPAR